MTNKWTISFQYWTITFCTNKEQNIAPKDCSIYETGEIDAAWKALTEGKQDVWVWVKSLSEAMRFVLSRHIYVKAAGGIVTNPKGESLLIYRNEHWDLPKGMIEPGETPEIGAIREVEEETGLVSPIIEKLLLTSYHVYNLYGGWHIKKTYWYEMSCDSDSALTPQIEEGIIECRWCGKEERAEHLNQSYSMMKMINDRLQ